VTGLVLALDSGTQSSRAIAYDAHGTQVAMGSATHQPLSVSGEGAVTQSPHDVWSALSSSIRTCMDALGPRAADVVAVGLTTQRYTMIPCTADFTPLMDAIHWLDRREGLLDDSWLLRTVAAIPTFGTIFSMSRGHVLKTVEPEIYAKTERYLPLSAWLAVQLIGDAVDTPGSFPGLWPIDARTGKLHGHDRMAKMLATPRTWLPTLVDAGAELGVISDACFQDTGIPVGIPVVAIGGDKQAELLGAGVVAGEDSVAAISLGTAASVTTLTRKFQQDMGAKIYTLASAEPKAWCLEYMLNRGMWMVTWACRELFRGASFAELETDAQATPMGAEGLTCLPRWGAPVASPYERGTLIGFTEAHTRGHIYRAIIEGICMDLRRGLAVLEKQAGRSLPILRVGGGGSQSDWIVQTLANVMGRAVSRGGTQELSALGAAMGAAVHTGWYSSYAEAAEEMGSPGRTFDPDPDARVLYDTVYKDIFSSRLSGIGGLLRR
jgi:sugar (pentulose or hexulose) kinase